MRRWAWVAGVVLCTAGCGKGEGTDKQTQPSVPGTLSAARAPADSDVTARGSGLPRGYAAQFDSPDAKATDASYREDGNGRWEVRTGPAHIVYAAGDTTGKAFTLSATFEQLEAPAHPEAYGVFFGGTALDQPAQRRYTYVLVRGDGKYMVKVRDGAQVRTVTDWTAHPAIPVQDAQGKALYGLKVDVDGKTANVSVNGKPVTTFLIKNMPVEGIAGVRINHNLHLMVTPASVVRR